MAQETGAPEKELEIEVTPEMIRAGVQAFQDWDESREEIEDLVFAIFLRMCRLARTPRQ